MILQSKGSLLTKATIGLLTMFFVLNLCWKIVLSGSYAPELGGFERNVIWGIQQLLAGNALYTNPDTEPFAMVQYMPLYYLVMAKLSSAAGIQPDDVHAIYHLARGFNLILTLLISGMVFSMLRFRLKVSPELAAGFGLLSFLLIPAFMLSARPDSLKAFFVIAHVFILIFFQTSRLRYLLPASLACALLCFLCKQDALTSFGLLPLAFVMGKEWRNFFLYSILAGAIVGLCILFLQNHSHGWFLANALGALQNGISISWFKAGFFSFFGNYAIFFAPALVLCLEFSQEKNRIFRILSAAFLISFFPQLAASLKFGSASNYFMEATLLSCLLLAPAMEANQGKLIFRFKESIPLFLLASILLWFSVPSLEWAGGVFLHQEDRLKKEYLAEKATADQIRISFPDKKFLLLTDRQWEDYLTTLLWNRVLNPNRDVSEQVFNGKKGNALQALKQHITDSNQIALITKTGQSPAFPGMEFSVFRQVKSFGNYSVWLK